MTLRERALERVAEAARSLFYETDVGSWTIGTRVNKHAVLLRDALAILEASGLPQEKDGYMVALQGPNGEPTQAPLRIKSYYEKAHADFVARLSKEQELCPECNGSRMFGEKCETCQNHGAVDLAGRPSRVLP